MEPLQLKRQTDAPNFLQDTVKVCTYTYNYFAHVRGQKNVKYGLLKGPCKIFQKLRFKNHCKKVITPLCLQNFNQIDVGKEFMVSTQVANVCSRKNVPSALVLLCLVHFFSEQTLHKKHRSVCKGPSIKDVSPEGEGGGYP